MPSTTRSGALCALAATAVLCCGAVSCQRAPEAEPSAGDTDGTAATSMPEPDQRYANIAGTIVDLPHPSRPLSDLQIAHEPIPNFVNREGVVPDLADGSTGMPAMTMAFPVGPGVSLDGLEIGDRVRLDFAVRWDHTPRWWLTRIEPAE